MDYRYWRLRPNRRVDLRSGDRDGSSGVSPLGRREFRLLDPRRCEIIFYVDRSESGQFVNRSVDTRRRTGHEYILEKVVRRKLCPVARDRPVGRLTVIVCGRKGPSYDRDESFSAIRDRDGPAHQPRIAFIIELIPARRLFERDATEFRTFRCKLRRGRQRTAD